MNNILPTEIERIKHFVEYKGLSMRSFSLQCGFSPGLIRNTKTITADKMRSIVASYPEINPVWLLLGEGKMTLAEGVTQNEAVLMEKNTKLTQLNEGLIEEMAKLKQKIGNLETMLGKQEEIIKQSEELIEQLQMEKKTLYRIINEKL